MSQVSRFCENCGARLEPASRFCASCGTPVNAPPLGPPVVASPTPPAPPVQPPPSTPPAQAAPPAPPTAPVEPAPQAQSGGASGQMIKGILGGAVVGLVLAAAIVTQGQMPELSTLPFWPGTSGPASTAVPSPSPAAGVAPATAAATPLAAAASPAPAGPPGSIRLDDVLGEWVVMSIQASVGVPPVDQNDVVGRTIKIERSGAQGIRMAAQGDRDEDAARVEVTQSSGQQIRGAIVDEPEQIKIALELSGDRQQMTMRFWPPGAPETGPDQYSMRLNRAGGPRLGAAGGVVGD